MSRSAIAWIFHGFLVVEQEYQRRLKLGETFVLRALERVYPELIAKAMGSRCKLPAKRHNCQVK